MLPGWSASTEIWGSFGDALGKENRLIKADWQDEFSFDNTQSPIEKEILRQDLHELIILGWSMGSLAALELAGNLQDRVKGLLLISATSCFTQQPPEYHSGWPIKILKRMKKKLCEDKSAVLNDFRSAMFSADESRLEEVERIMFSATENTSKEETRLLCSGLDYLSKTDLRSSLKKIDVPTLLIHGTADKICPPAASEFIMDSKSGHTELVTLPEAGHAPFLTQPKKTLSAISKFLDSL